MTYYSWRSPVLERKQLKGKTQVTFVLPENIPEGPVSVVGDFNLSTPEPSHGPAARYPDRRRPGSVA
ncbi:hypothetical protein [Streptomyces sp. XY66]|uniref:hypothetical protein n=1 Tax=Streptomyces sp. XY66 TaxID=1415563 RepID=UPI00131D296F|nr:hypothetical protein [Streptomyces sp. XY66]